MRDFVVYVVGQVGEKPVKAPEKPVQVVTKKQVAQKGAMFSPHVLPVVVGTTVDWPNDDDVLHNVFSVSEAKTFDLQLYNKELTQVRTKSFLTMWDESMCFVPFIPE